MRIYARCDGCKAEGLPLWVSPGLTGQFGNHGGYHAPPSGWTELGTFLLCQACTEKVKGRLAEIVVGNAQAKPPQALIPSCSGLRAMSDLYGRVRK